MRSGDPSPGATSAAATLPSGGDRLADAAAVARRLCRAMAAGEGASLLRFGDTGGRVLAAPDPGSPNWAYLQRFLGRTITPAKVAWLGERIREAAHQADVVGLRSDLLGPMLQPADLDVPDEDLRAMLLARYPLRAFERTNLDLQGARRLAETRLAMQRFRFQGDAVLTHAWIHVELAEIGFISAVLREARSVALITSVTRKDVVSRMAKAMGGRLRFYECPDYPHLEHAYGADPDFIWDRWRRLLDSVKPAWPGEPLLISAGIWTKPIATSFRQRGGVAVDFGSVLDYLDGAATRPAVLADRFGTPQQVPAPLTLAAQLSRTERLSDYA